MRVEPLKCLRANPERVGEVASPPYDVFDRASAAAYLEAHPSSFLAVDRPDATLCADVAPDAPEVYERARELLLERRRDFTLLSDETPCFYVYELQSAGRRQTGVIGAVAVDDYLDGTVARHELTRADKELDRVRHIEATGAQTGLVLLAYPDQLALDVILGSAKQAQPLYDFTADGVRHLVWRVARPAATEAIEAAFTCVPKAYIADGHHRAAAAARVCERRRAERGEAGAAGSFLAALFPASQLRILAYDRAVTDLAGLAPAELLGRLERAGFSVSEARYEPVRPQERGHFGCYLAGRWHELAWGREPGACDADAAASLDVSVLQDEVLGPILGVQDPRRDARMRFLSESEGPAALEAAAGDEGVAFTLFPTTMDDLMRVSDAGGTMPPKSTWFEPKLPSGLVVRRIDQ